MQPLSIARSLLITFGKETAGVMISSVLITTVRKHMVSLRGSKFGSRVAMLCCNPAYATRPGAPMGMHVASRFAPATNNMGRGTIGGPY